MDTSVDMARHRDVSEFVKDEPLTALAIAAAAGFVLGGGINRRLGMTILTTIGRIALQSAATSLITGMVVGAGESGKPSKAGPHS